METWGIEVCTFQTELMWGLIFFFLFCFGVSKQTVLSTSLFFFLIWASCYRDDKFSDTCFFLYYLSSTENNNSCLPFQRSNFTSRDSQGWLSVTGEMRWCNSFDGRKINGRHALLYRTVDTIKPSSSYHFYCNRRMEGILTAASILAILQKMRPLCNFSPGSPTDGPSTIQLNLFNVPAYSALHPDKV